MGWEVEGVRSFGPNMVSFIVTPGRKHWYVVRAYMSHNNLLTVHWIMQALACRAEGVGKLLVGNLNA